MIAAMDGGLEPEFFFFWGHRPLPGGRIGKPCLSQWWAGEFSVDGVTYPTAEHFMMAEKARLFGDDEACEEILAAPDPGAAKKLGRKVRGFDEERWRAARFDIVVRGNLAKFSQRPELCAFLHATRDQVLVEASPDDRIWGIGLSATDPRAPDPHQWQGLNLLGFALMEVRSELGRAW